MPPEEVRLLELLSLTRTFDRRVFETVAAGYRLPGHQLAWDSLTAYSFVDATIAGQYQLHQLMVGALRSRLPAELSTDVHRTLRRHWDSRVDPEATMQRGPANDVTALREAVHHGLRAGELTGDELLGYADCIMALGDAAMIGPMIDDIEEMLRAGAVEVAESLEESVRCLKAEAAYLAGAPERVPATGPTPEPDLTTSARVRLALAGAHAAGAW